MGSQRVGHDLATEQQHASKLEFPQRLCGNKSAYNEETQEMGVQFLGQEDPLEKEMATHSSILAWKILWM